MKPDDLWMRVIIEGLSAAALETFEGVEVIGRRPAGTEIETPRYRAFTDLAKDLAAKGAEFIEIAGNDDILFTTISDQPTPPDALHRFVRQGNPGYRHLVLIKVADLGRALREGAGVEHVHDDQGGSLFIALPMVAMAWIAILAGVMWAGGKALRP